MNQGQLEIKCAGHRAAQKVALQQAKCWHERIPLMRKHALNRIEEVGFGRFLLRGHSVDPIAEGTRKDDSGESWTHWAVFSTAEVKAWCEAFGYEYMAETAEWSEGEPCPHCGCEHVRWSSYHEWHQCPNCRAVVESVNDLRRQLCQALTGWGSHYGGPGQSFHHEPRIRVGSNHILVTWNGGLDI
jgi:hypothetical protein